MPSDLRAPGPTLSAPAVTTGQAILTGWLLCGVLDIAAACVQAWSQAGRTPAQVNPRLGETYQEALDVKGNPSIDMDWYETKFKATNEPYRYTVAHWCATEARFRNHLKKIKPDEAARLISLAGFPRA